MKTNKILIYVLVTLIVMFSLTSCKRANLDDPSMQKNSGFRIILSGTANPSTLYVPEDSSEFSTTVRVQALDNKGTPVNGSKIIFEQTGNFFGYFDNNKISTSVITNSNGVAQVNYMFPAGIYIASTQFLEVTATLIDDGRLDPHSGVSTITDTIPIRVVTNGNTATGQYEIHGHNALDNGTGVSGITITFTNLGPNGTTSITTVRSSGSWEHYVPKGWTGVITPTNSNYTFSPSNRIVSTMSEDLDNVNFIAIPK